MYIATFKTLFSKNKVNIVHSMMWMKGSVKNNSIYCCRILGSDDFGSNPGSACCVINSSLCFSFFLYNEIINMKQLEQCLAHNS